MYNNSEKIAIQTYAILPSSEWSRVGQVKGQSTERVYVNNLSQARRMDHCRASAASQRTPIGDQLHRKVNFSVDDLTYKTHTQVRKRYSCDGFFLL